MIIIINYLLFLLLLNTKLCIITQMLNSYCHYVIHMIHTMYAYLAEKQLFYTCSVAQMSRIANVHRILNLYIQHVDTF